MAKEILVCLIPIVEVEQDFSMRENTLDERLSRLSRKN